MSDIVSYSVAHEVMHAAARIQRCIHQDHAPMPLDRRSFLAFSGSFGLASTLFPGALYTLAAQASGEPKSAAVRPRPPADRAKPGGLADQLPRGAFYPAVEYIQANRARTLAIEQVSAVFRQVDVIVARPGRAPAAAARSRSAGRGCRHAPPRSRRGWLLPGRRRR